MCGCVVKMKYFKGKYLNHSIMLYAGISSHCQITFVIYLCGGRKRDWWHSQYRLVQWHISFVINVELLSISTHWKRHRTCYLVFVRLCWQSDHYREKQYNKWYVYQSIVNLTNQHQGFFQGGGEHSPLLGFGLPLLGNFNLKVNHSSVLKYLIVALCIINVNKSLKYCMYVYTF